MTTVEASAIPAWRRDPLPRELSVAGVLMVTDYLIAVATVAAVCALAPWDDLSARLLWPPALLWPVAFLREGLYPGYSLSRQDKLRAYVMNGLMVAVVLMAFQPVLLGDARARLASLAIAGLLIGPAAYAGRIVWQRILHHLGVWGRPVIVLGAGETGQRIAGSLRAHHLQGLKPVAFFDDDAAKHGRRIGGVPVLGALDDAEAYAGAHGIDHAIVAIPRLAQPAVARLTSTDGRVFKRVQLVPDLPGVPVEAVQARSLSNQLTLEVRNNLRLRRNRTMKRTFDLTATILGGIAISPLLAALALAVRLDSRGPVLYSQERIGRGGKRFRIWKFRSMVVDADAKLARYLDEHPDLRAEWEATHKLANDPRVTRVGRFLRKTSLDELPQLINVIRGEMSLVGPRPIVEAEVVKYAEGYELYKLVRPGMTGYWQTSGRSETSYAWRVELDAYYAKNWSVWFDLVILLATARVVMRADGAY